MQEDKAIAEKQENHTGKIPLKYHTCLTNMTAALGSHVNATSRKSVEIQAYWLSQKEKNHLEMTICLNISF